jgi:hypothetical protein
MADLLSGSIVSCSLSNALPRASGEDLHRAPEARAQGLLHHHVELQIADERPA